MRRQFKPLWISALVLLALPSMAAANSSELAITLEAISPNRLLLELTLHNQSKDTLDVLTWNTPFEETLNADSFQVSYEGTTGANRAIPIGYLERHAKRSAGALENTLRLGPGEGISVEVDISHGYETWQQGFYSIQFDTSLRYFSAGQSSDIPRIVEAESNTVLAYQGFELAPLSSKQPATFSACSNSEQTTIDSALTAAEELATVAAEALNSTPIGQRPTAQRYTTWFGSYQSARYTSVTTNFNAILDAAANQTVGFICHSDRCGRGTFAFVYTNSPYEVYVCDGFWGAELTGTDSKAGTIIHELSHFTVVSNTDDHQYGQSAAKQLAISNPSLAINNADSHEYFAENTPALSMSGGTAPPPVEAETTQQLTVGAAFIGEIGNAGQWQYFQVTGAAQVTLSNLSADLDLYVGNGALPTETSFQCRPYASGTNTESCTISAEGVTLLGVNAYSAGSFSLIATTESAATQSPETPVIDTPGVSSLTLGSAVSDSVAQGQWSYYTVTGASQIRLFGLSADADLYIRNSQIPTETEFSCRPYDSGTSEETCFVNPTETTFIGVNGFESSSYSLIAENTTEQVSATAQTLVVGEPVSAFLEVDQWDYYVVTGASEIRLFGLSADADLYIGNGQSPTEENFLCRPFSTGVTEEFCLVNPNEVTFIGINAFESSSYSLIALSTSEQVSSTTQSLLVNQPVSAFLELDQWAYYNVTGANSVTLSGLSADLDLYFSTSGLPSLENYICRPFLSGTNTETCEIPDSEIAIIGVNAYEAGSYTLTASAAAASSVETITLEANQSEFVPGDPLLLTMNVTSSISVDTYAAIFTPSGGFFTVSPTLGVTPASNGILNPYHRNLQVDGEQTHTILNFTLPGGLEAGTYQACGLMVGTGLSLVEENWSGLHCVNFEINSSSKIDGKKKPKLDKRKAKASVATK